MSGLAKGLLGLGALVLIVGLYLVFRPDDTRDEPAELAPNPAAETAETETDADPGTGTETETGEAPAQPTGPRIIRLTVDEGEADIERVDIEQGERVVLVIRSDVADHVHLHGYDLMRDVAPGEPARIRFRADIPGRFEVELEDRQQQFAQLTVAP